MKLTVNNSNGLQLLLPNINEPMYVDEKPDVPTGHPPEHEECAFTGKVSHRICFCKKLEQFSGVASPKYMKVSYNGANICLLEVGFETNVGYKRYVLKGWPEFMIDNGISAGDFCYFRYVTTEDVLFVSRCEN